MITTVGLTEIKTEGSMMERKRGRPSKYGFDQIEVGSSKVFTQTRFQLVSDERYFARVQRAALNYAIYNKIRFSTSIQGLSITVWRLE